MTYMVLHQFERRPDRSHPVVHNKSDSVLRDNANNTTTIGKSAPVQCYTIRVSKDTALLHRAVYDPDQHACQQIRQFPFRNS